MRVVVTGSRGFIGRRLVEALWSKGVRPVRVSANPKTPATGSGPPVHFYDLAEPRTYLPAGVAGEPFLLVHLAWDTGRSPLYAEQARQLDRLARWLDGWLGRGLAGVVMPGTADEYGARSGRLAEDDTPVGRLSGYGWGKAAARGLLANVSAGGVPVVWLRPFLVYGPGQEGNMVVPYAVRQALAGAPADFSDGLQRRDFLAVEDVVTGFVAAVRGVCDGGLTGWHCLNLGTGRGTPVRAVLQRIAAGLGAEGRFRFGALPRRPGESDELVADPRRAANVLGWRATMDWEEGVERLVAAARDEGAWRAGRARAA
jgi:nucleoside-diphosphate-sugar epimerase